MPMQILEPYFRFIDQMQSSYQLGNNLGKPRGDKCSIPQGCPFSMTMVAIIMRPWIMMMLEAKVTPRVLADDLLITTEGVGHLSRVVNTVALSFKYFEDIGAKVADNKCFTFSTDKETRKYLRDKKWRHNGKHIPLKNSFRDLGSHLNFTKTTHGATLTKRIQNAISMCQRLKLSLIHISEPTRPY